MCLGDLCFGDGPGAGCCPHGTQGDFAIDDETNRRVQPSGFSPFGLAKAGPRELPRDVLAAEYDDRDEQRSLATQAAGHRRAWPPVRRAWPNRCIINYSLTLGAVRWTCSAQPHLLFFGSPTARSLDESCACPERGPPAAAQGVSTAQAQRPPAIKYELPGNALAKQTVGKVPCRMELGAIEK